MNYYDGSAYQELYPTANLSSNVTGILPLNKGGTGTSTATNALYALINGCSIVTESNLATDDYLGIGDTNARNGKKITLSNFIDFLSNNSNSDNFVLKNGSYTGTGSYSFPEINIDGCQNYILFYCGIYNDYSLFGTLGYVSDHIGGYSALLNQFFAINFQNMFGDVANGHISISENKNTYAYISMNTSLTDTGIKITFERKSANVPGGGDNAHLYLNGLDKIYYWGALCTI